MLPFQMQTGKDWYVYCTIVYFSTGVVFIWFIKVAEHLIVTAHTDTDWNKPAAAATCGALPLHWNGLVGAAAGPAATNGLVDGGAREKKNSYINLHFKKCPVLKMQLWL